MRIRIMPCLLGAAALLALGLSGGASATLSSCPANIGENAEGAIDCQYSDTEPANNGEATVTAFVNSEAYFSLDSWQAAGRGNSNGTSDTSAVNIGLSVSFDDPSTSGSYSIDEMAFDDWENIMLIFKDGNATNPVGHLLSQASTVVVEGPNGLVCSSGTCQGDWISPFDNPPFNVQNPREVSYIAAFVSDENDAEVPEPGILLLLGAGLAGMGFMRRRAR